MELDGARPLGEEDGGGGVEVVRPAHQVHRRVLAEARAETAHTAMLAIPNTLEAGEIIAKLREINPALTIVARAHSDGELRHLLEHGADAAVMAERELAHSLAEMVMATPPYRGNHHLPPAVA